MSLSTEGGTPAVLVTGAKVLAIKVAERRGH
jgi:hypothetical protein